MRKIVAVSFWFSVLAIIFAKGVVADTIPCPGYKFQPDPTTLVEGEFHEIIFSAKVNDLGDTYAILGGGTLWHDRFEARDLVPNAEGRLPDQTITTDYLLSARTHALHIKREGLDDDYCTPYSYTVAPAPTPTSKFIDCRLEAISDPPDKLDSGSTITINGTGLSPLAGGITYELRVQSRDGAFDRFYSITVSGGSFEKELPNKFNNNTYDVILGVWGRGGYGDTSCRTWFKIHPTEGEAPTPAPTCPQECKDILNKKYPPGPSPDYACLKPQCKQNCSECKVECPFPKCIDLATELLHCDIEECRENCLGCGATPEPTTVPVPELETLCKGTKNYNDCINCVRGEGIYAKSQGGAGPGIWTALGCIPTNLSDILKNYIFTYGIGIAGGIAFLLMLFGAFTVMTSAGNPENVAKGKEMITSALTGLLIIIFSVFILRLIGVDILRIPGFR